MDLRSENKETLVYIDVTNTVQVDFITGIQKITKALITAFMEAESDAIFQPIYYCSNRRTWVTIGRVMKQHLFRDDPITDGWVNRWRGRWRRRLRYGMEGKKVEWKSGARLLFLDAAWNNKGVDDLLFQKLNERNVQCIWFVHDLIPLKNPEWFKASNLKAFRRFAELNKNYTKDYWASTEAVASDIRQWLGKERDVNVNIVPFGWNSYDAKIEEKSKIVLSVGTVEIRKNYALMLDTMESFLERNKEWSWLIIGKPGWNNDVTLEKLSQHKSLGSRIIWRKNVSDLEVKSAYASASILFNASWEEGYGMPIIEGWIAGARVVCSDIPVYREHSEGHALFFDPRSKQQALEKLELAMNRCISQEAVVRPELPSWKSVVQDWIDAIL